MEMTSESQRHSARKVAEPERRYDQCDQPPGRLTSPIALAYTLLALVSVSIPLCIGLGTGSYPRRPMV